MADAPRPGAKPGLEPLLGAEGCARLQRALVARALAWAAEATEAVFVAYAPADAEDELAALAPPGATLFAQAGEHLGARLEDAFARVAEAHGGPVVVVGTDQPALSRVARVGGRRRPARRRRRLPRAGDGRRVVPARRGAPAPRAVRDRPGGLGRAGGDGADAALGARRGAERGLAALGARPLPPGGCGRAARRSRARPPTSAQRWRLRERPRHGATTRAVRLAFSGPPCRPPPASWSATTPPASAC